MSAQNDTSLVQSDVSIIVSDKNGIQTVSARDLHEKLESNQRFSKWWERFSSYGFVENEDFVRGCTKKYAPKNQYTSELQEIELDDYAITIEMAKQICMLQRSEKGKLYREYFLKLEKAWNTPEAIFARALQAANGMLAEAKRKIDMQQVQLIETKQRAEAAEDSLSRLTNASGEKTVQEVAKILGYGSNNFYALLRGMGILYKDNGINLPKQEYINSGYFIVKVENFTRNGEDCTYSRIFVTTKGLTWLEKKTKESA